MLVAGASGLLGGQVVRLLADAGFVLRTLSHRPRGADRLRAFTDDVRLADATAPGALAGLCDGVDVVVSALGASVRPDGHGRAGFRAVDAAANRALLAEATRAGVWRFVYVAAHVEDGYRHTAYVRAHEEVVDALRAASLTSIVLRPTGVFGSLSALLPMARRGVLPLVGDGTARTNPIHEADVAAAAVTAVGAATPAPDQPLGGPEVMTRAEIARLAFAVQHRTPRLLRVPAGVMGFASRCAGPFSSRTGELLEFVTAVSTTDCIAPARGTRRLEDYFRQHAGWSRAAATG